MNYPIILVRKLTSSNNGFSEDPLSSINSLFWLLMSSETLSRAREDSSLAKRVFFTKLINLIRFFFLVAY